MKADNTTNFGFLGNLSSKSTVRIKDASSGVNAHY